MPLGFRAVRQPCVRSTYSVLPVSRRNGYDPRIVSVSDSIEDDSVGLKHLSGGLAARSPPFSFDGEWSFGQNPTTARRRSDVLPDIVRQSSGPYYAARAKSLGEFEHIQELQDISGPLIGPQHSSRLRVNSDELPASTKIGIDSLSNSQSKSSLSPMILLGARQSRWPLLAIRH
jgi:hypothetical protein